MGRENNLTGIVRALRLHDVNDLRNDITCTADNDFIANTQAQAGNFVGIVQSRVADQHARDLHRFKARNRRDSACAPYLELHVAHKGHLLLCREFKRDSPARRAGDKAQLFLQRQGIHFNHHAVDIKPQRRAVFFNFVIKRQHGFGRVTQLYAVANRQAPLFKLQQTPQMGIRQYATFQDTDAVAEESERSLRRNTRVQLTQ
ncbi:hypothetical protein D3C78_658020 [compost metagenome]